MIILIAFSIVLAGIANSIMDTLAHHYKDSVFAKWNAQYWNPAESWRNKYKGGIKANGPAFPLADSALSFLTDGWHLAKFVMLTAIAFPPAVAIHHLTGGPWWALLVAYIICRAVFAVCFHLFYHKILFHERAVPENQ